MYKYILVQQHVHTVHSNTNTELITSTYRTNQRTSEKVQTSKIKIIIVYYSIGFTELALEFGGKLAKLGWCIVN